jgi:seryl-tRNA synthetase
MDYMVKQGYVPLSVPVLIKDESMTGTGFFPGFEDQTYRMEKDKLNLAGTAEVPLTAYHAGEILSAEQLPLKYVALSTCFRREAGAAGKDTYGLYRIHQFDKVEQVVICKNSVEESNKFHEEILANAEHVMQALELPYRVANVCTGDLGRGQAKKFDIETWMPSRENYCETHSASKLYDFQARRMNLRYKEPKTKKNLFCHTLNNTVIASPRILIPLLELYQNADGSVTIPKAIRPYMNGKEKITKGS